jgi:hypothetical protein
VADPRTSAWDRYWFGEASLVRLAAFRIIMMAAAFYALHQFRVGVLQHADGLDATWVRRDWNPIYLLDLLHLSPPGPVLARVVFWILLGAILSAIMGSWTRTSCAVVAVLLTYWIAIAYSFGKPHHDCIALVLGLWTLPLAPVGERLSLDGWLARRRRALEGRPREPRRERAACAALPLHFTAITIVIGYFFSGATKLAVSGLEWMNGYTLQAHMLGWDAPWSAFFSQHVEIVRLMSVGLIAVQLFFPLALFVPSTRWFFLPMGIVFHLLAWATMDTGPFLTLWFPFAAFLPLEQIPERVERLVLDGPLARRVFLGCVLAAAALGIGYVYFRILPPAAYLGVAPLVWMAAGRARERKAGAMRRASA